MRFALFVLFAIGLGCNAQMGGPASPSSTSSSGARECKLNSDGQQTCGYNCKLGSHGSWYCASTPNGQCALNSDGTWTCP